jgi:hypothetical protein
MARPIPSSYFCLSLWYLLDLQRCTNDPLNKFDNDLQVFVQECINAGEFIAMGIYVNEDVRDGDFTKKMNTLGLINICTHKHGGSVPPTYTRGSVPIDALYVSPMLLGLECGYLKIMSDHHILWMDIPHEMAFAWKMSQLPARQPQC